MKKLDTTKLTEEQQKLINDELGILATVGPNDEPVVGPKGSLRVLDPEHLVYLEYTKGHAFENVNHGSKVAAVFVDLPAHKAVRVMGTTEVHEGDDFAKEQIEKAGREGEMAVVVIKIEAIYA
ncbi:MAG: pyridoxamine 5'-phosphate oxidase family protein [Lactobacillus sp.]|nr:pyridoxamine 5'-phosphate oxidase family protein [Lactobacillus sp.]